jgi:threonine synthase
MNLPTFFVCSGCGERVEGSGLPPFRCPHAREGDNVDHVLERRLDVAHVPFPAPDDDNPFIAFRSLLGSYQRAGVEDQAWVEQVRALDRRVAEVDGHGFSKTPFGDAVELARAVGWKGRLRVKDETGNVAGSHKARHLMGLMLYLETLPGAPARERPLAISSCGNAALAAAVVASAAGRTLRVFVPTWAEPAVVSRLDALGATVEVCQRDGAEPGDPCTLGFRRAVTEGAVPFSCQGSDNGLVVEGGMTLAYEMLAASAPPDRIFVQVGGGALASATVQAYEEAERRGAGRLPRFHAVQTEAVAPLCRAWARVMRRVLPALGYGGELPPESGAGIELDSARQWADLVREHRDGLELEAALGYAVTHKNEFMWPWEGEPHGLAHGILDDETYDWFAVTRGMLRSGGFPIVVSDPTVAEANRLARASTTIPVDATGSSGLAGLLTLGRAGIGVDDDAVVLFTGRDRAR